MLPLARLAASSSSDEHDDLLSIEQHLNRGHNLGVRESAVISPTA